MNELDLVLLEGQNLCLEFFDALQVLTDTKLSFPLKFSFDQHVLVPYDMVCDFLHGVICFEIPFLVCQIPEFQQLLVAMVGIFVLVEIPPDQVRYLERTLWYGQ